MNENFEKIFEKIRKPANLTDYSINGIKQAAQKKHMGANIMISIKSINLKQLFFMTKKRAIICVTSFVLIFAFILTMFMLPFNTTLLTSANSITPTKSDANGINVNTEFIIKTTDYKNTQDLAKNLTINTDEKFKIEKQLLGDFKLTFNNPLQSNKLYDFVLNTTQSDKISYAFQTKQEFKVSHTLPADNSQEVPINSGIEISFTLVNFKDYDKYIQITPKVEGKFTKYSNTLVFIPDKLDTNTVYKVTIKKGLSSDSSESLKEDYQFSFQTSTDTLNNSYINISGDRTETFLSQDNPVVEIYASDDYKNSEFTTQVFSVQKPEDYAAIIQKATDDVRKYNFNRNIYDIVKTDGYTKILDFKSKLVLPNPNNIYLSYVVLPKLLPVGYYIVNISGELNGKKVLLQKFLQINDDAVYVMTNNGTSLLWVNDTKTGKPLTGADVFVDNKNMGKISANGTLSFKTTENKKNASVIISGKGVKPFSTCMPLIAQNPNPPLNEKYFSYLYTDREGYLATDKIKVFGILKPRNGSDLPKTADVYVYSNSMTNQFNYYDEYGNQKYDLSKALIKTQVTIGDNGVFTADIKLDNLSSSSYQIILAQSGNVITVKYISVENYVKPIYKMNFKEQLDVYFVNETYPMNANVSFYDGTPAVNLPFDAKMSQSNDSQMITSDKNGNLYAEFITSDYGGNKSWYPESEYINLECKSADDKTLTQGKAITVLPRTVMLENKVSSNGNKPIITISTNKITKDKLTIENVKTGNLTDFIRGAAVDMPVTVRIMKNTNVKTKISSTYDYIEKKSIDNYSYSMVTNVESEKTVKTVGGKYTLDNLPVSTEADIYYTCDLECYDTNGQIIIDSVYYYSYIPQYSSNNVKSFYFTDDINQNENSAYNLNENVSIKLHEQYGGAITTGKALYTVMKDGITQYNVAESLPFNVKFIKDYIPNVYIGGAYFDGKRIYPVNYFMLRYKYTNNNLNIKLTPDKKSYKPGDTVNLDVSVTDKNGNPQKSDVNLSVVDESIFSMFPQQIDLLKQLYMYNYMYNSSAGNSSQYVSYYQHSGSSNIQRGSYGSGSPANPTTAEGGGLNSVGMKNSIVSVNSGTIRSEFKDTASFLLAKTDINGKAKVTFKLPDNLTSWRISSQAVTADNFAGNNNLNITTNLPFFADMVLNRTYLTRDDIAVTARCFGTALGNDVSYDTPVSYTVTLTDAKGEKTTKTISALASDYASINFGAKPAGTYKMMVKAQCGSYSDAIEKSFNVIENGTELYISKTFDLSKGIDINALKSPVQLVAYNKQTSAAYRSLLDMCYSGGSRNDELFAQGFAANKLNSLSEENNNYFTSPDYSNNNAYQGQNGGALLYSYDSESPLLTARFIMADAKSLNEINAKQYLYGIVNNYKETDKEKIAAAYFGLAAYKEPVLIQVQNIITNGKDLSLKTKLILACALAALGDDVGAKSLFDKSFSDKFVNINSENAMLKCSTDDAVNDEMTALSLYVLTKSDKPLAQKVMNYILQNPSKYYLSSLEQIYYIKNAPVINTVSSVQYQLNSETKQFTLKNDKSNTLVMTTEQLKNAAFKVLSGNVEVKAIFTGTSENLSKDSSVIKVDKQYVSSSKTYNIGDDIKVTINLKLPDKTEGYYNITDFIPSGARFVRFDGDASTNNVWFNKSEGQKINFGYYQPKIGYSPDELNITYYIRAVTGGNYSVESVFVTRDNKWGWSNRGTIKFEK
jgi:uncharacterized protein YfaS (alpha-2-macroglobulin family)